MEKMKELLVKAEELVEVANKAIASDVYSDISIAKINLKEAISAYNEEAKNVAYRALLAFPDAEVLTQALQNAYYGVKTAKFKVDAELDREVASIEDSEELINLIELEDTEVRKLSINGQWRYWLEKFNKLMSARVIEDVGTDEEKKRFESFYKISQKANNCDIGATPTSNNQTVKMLQSIVDGVVFKDNGKGLNAYKVTTKDIRYIEYLMCRQGKARRSISTPRFSTMLKLFTIALSRIVLDTDYAIEFEEIKKK